MVPVQVSLPDWPYGNLNAILFAEAAAAFEELTLVETRVERTDSAVRIVHVFEYGPEKARLLTEPFEGYA